VDEEAAGYHEECTDKPLGVQAFVPHDKAHHALRVNHRIQPKRRTESRTLLAMVKMDTCSVDADAAQAWFSDHHMPI
jgi:hypothetical protein